MFLLPEPLMVRPLTEAELHQIRRSHGQDVEERTSEACERARKAGNRPTVVHPTQVATEGEPRIMPSGMDDIILIVDCGFRMTSVPGSVTSLAGCGSPEAAPRTMCAVPSTSVQPKEPKATPSMVVPGWRLGGLHA